MTTRQKLKGPPRGPHSIGINANRNRKQGRIFFGTHIQPWARKLLEQLLLAEWGKDLDKPIQRHYIIEQSLLSYARQHHPNLVPKRL